MNWTTNTIADILPEEFYSLVDRNREHIAKGLPMTLAGNGTLENTVIALEQSAVRQEKGEVHYHYLRNTDTNTLIGYASVKNIDNKIAKCELAYFVDKDHQGKGIITKAVADLLAFCFEALYMNKVTICTALDNYGSQRIALKHGFSQEGIFRKEFRNGEGMLEDMVYFGLLRSEYYEK